MNPLSNANASNLIRTARAVQQNVYFGYPAGVSLTDFVTDDMKALVFLSSKILVYTVNL